MLSGVNFIKNCAGFIKTCIKSFKKAPFEIIFNGVLHSILSFGINNFLAILVAIFANVVDIITGVVKARRNDDFSSSKAFEKLIKLMVYLLVIILSYSLAVFASWLFIIGHFVCGFITWIEFESIIENLEEAGFKVSYLKRISDGFKKLLDSGLKTVLDEKKK